MVDLFVKGGNFMWPILGIFIMGLIFVGERLVHLLSTKNDNTDFAENVASQLDGAGALEAQTLCESGKGPIPNLLATGLENLDKEMSDIEKSIDSQANVEMSSLEKNMTWIALCIATAPMLGFLGTVWGMVGAFEKIAEADNISASIVAGGISEALLTTAFGLVVAVVLQILQNTVLYIIDNKVVSMQKAVNLLMGSIEKLKK